MKKQNNIKVNLQVKKTITEALQGLNKDLEALDTIKKLKEPIKQDIDRLKQDLSGVIDWYFKETAKEALLHYLEDYQKLEARFQLLAKKLPENKCYYGLCLEEQRIKLYVNDIPPKPKTKQIPEQKFLDLQ